jgi:hypothetical protein
MTISVADHETTTARSGGVRRRLAAVLVVGALGVLLIAGCGAGSDGDDSSNSSSGTRDVTFTVNATPVDGAQFYRTGGDGSLRYGFGAFTGQTTFLDAPAFVDLVGEVEYRDGSGSSSGFMTITDDVGDELALRYRGQTTTLSDGPSTIAGTLEVIGGTGAFTSVSGTGTMTGSPTGEAGTGVDYEIALTLSGLEAPTP